MWNKLHLVIHKVEEISIENKSPSVHREAQETFVTSIIGIMSVNNSAGCYVKTKMYLALSVPLLHLHWINQCMRE